MVTPYSLLNNDVNNHQIIEENFRALVSNVDCFNPKYKVYKNVTGSTQEGYIEELSTWYYLDTALLKSSESVLSETKIFNINMLDTIVQSIVSISINIKLSFLILTM